MDGPHLSGHPVPGADTAAEQGGYGAVSRLATAEEMLAAVLVYIACGVPVFPCVIGGKRPAVARGFLAATTDRRQVLNWWQGRHAGCNIGTPTGGWPGFSTSDIHDNKGEGKTDGSD